MNGECQTKNDQRAIKSGLSVLIVEDDFASRKALQLFLSGHGECMVVVNGKEAVEAFEDALDTGRPFDLICMDIVMPEMDGHETLKRIRQIESERRIFGHDGVKVIMTSTNDGSGDIFGAFREGCEAYIVKPVLKDRLFDEIEKLGLFNRL